MIIADKLKIRNRAEYVLYMWQVEDIIRSFGCDMERLRGGYLSQFDVGEKECKDIEAWYADLVSMMLAEGVREGGHLQINRNAVAELEKLHTALSRSPKYPFYQAAYVKALPHIVAVREHGGDKSLGEVELCLGVMYGVLLLRLQKKPISDATTRSVADITALLGMLSDYYMKNKEKQLEF